MAVCKKCLADIIWIRTAAGKPIPCNSAPVYYIEKPKSGKKKIVTPNGQVISCEYTNDSNKATGVGYIPHWSTCPYADMFRKSQLKGGISND